VERASLSFGTDGVRAIANLELTPEWVLDLGRAAARILCGHSGEGPLGKEPGRRCMAVGRDTRESGGMFAAALAAGVAAEGVDVVDLGVFTTPGVAWISSEREIPAAVVSASHNPYTDNGVKLFGAGGRKLSAEEEASIEEAIAGGMKGRRAEKVGRVATDPSASWSYENHLAFCLEGRRLEGMRVVLDCANGSASKLAPGLFRRLGADVVSIFDAPDGRNINSGCGSTDTGPLALEVKARGADMGLAFDGDADRCIAVDADGGEVDGDQMMALFAADLAERGRLASLSVVVTVMTNLGFHKAMERKGISVVVTDVGDRNVLTAMESGGFVLGGEQSGHLIFRDLATTGDGILTGLLLVDLVLRKGRPLAELASESMERFPQCLVSVPVADPARLEGANALWEEVSEVERAMAGKGRVLVRASGTEPKVRVMVEAPREREATEVARRLADAVRRLMA